MSMTLKTVHLPLLTFCAATIFTVSCKNKSQSIRPERAPIVESVYASAAIRAADQYSLYAPVTGILQDFSVKEGDSVSEGQRIAGIENTNPGLNAENARLGMEQARRNMGALDELRAQLATLSRQVRLDSLNYKRQQELWTNEVGTRAQYEKAQLAFESSVNSLRALQTRYRQQQQQLNTALEQAEIMYDMASKSSRDYTLTSKINGRVYALNYKPGELVNAQKPVAVLGRSGSFVIDMDVDEVDIARIRVGQQVYISMDAFPGQAFEARVTRILPSLDTKTQTFRVEAVFVNAPPALYPGLSAEANIVVSKKENALVIPLNYLKTPGSVLTEEGEVKVTTGLKSLDKVEILSGINEQTKLIKP